MRTTCTAKSSVANSLNGLPSGPTRNTVAGDAVPAKAVPLLSTATDQTVVEGVVTSSVRPGPARSRPSLESATPCGVPFSNSYSRDWVHKCVPCASAGSEAARKQARAGAERRNAERRRRMVRLETNILPLSLLKLGIQRADSRA